MAVLRQMALVALVVGTSLSVSATERIDVRLVATGALAWGFVPVLQLLTGLVLVRGARCRRADALESYFATHWPWSLWIIAVHGAYLLLPPLRSFSFYVLLTAIVPIVATAWLLGVVCREVVHLSERHARRRVLEHQAITYTLVIAYVQFAVALWPRLIGVLP